VVSSPSPGSHSNGLGGVAVISATNAWAVGNYSSRTINQAQTLIVHWNGTGWKQQSSPNPGPAFNTLSGVAATSATNAWAVGYYNAATPSQTLIVHWNGTAWKQQSSPNAGAHPNGTLTGVAATSATNAWAVGNYTNRTGVNQTLILHWNGTAWKKVPSPNPSSLNNDLFGVAATSATNAWAVGVSGPFQANQALIEHWDGTAWKQVPTPSSSASNVLFAVAASSSSNAWAVGDSCTDCGASSQSTGTLTLDWNGTAWTQQSSSIPGGSLRGVAATSATNAWAVGVGLIVHWDGTAWKQQSSPNPAAGLAGVAATSATNAWAVGGYRKGGISHTLTLHCC
jgi:hypothetical protein